MSDSPIIEAIIEAIKTVHDPEISVNIYDLGLIYSIKMKETVAHIDMTLTSANCPAAQELPVEVKLRAESVEGVSEAHVKIVWEPQWGIDHMSDEAKLVMNLL